MIGVAITTRDRPEALSRCLESLRVGRRPPAEVVVADQSSSHASRAVADGADCAELPVRWVDGGSKGLAGGQNAAFRHTTAPVVAVLDDDCVADPGWTEALEREFAADPVLALVGGRVLPLPGSGDRTFAVASRRSAKRREFHLSSSPWEVGSGNNFAAAAGMVRPHRRLRRASGTRYARSGWTRYGPVLPRAASRRPGSL